MRSSILTLLASSVFALASPTFRVSITLDEGIGSESPSQNVMSIEDPFNLDTPFRLRTPFQGYLVSPRDTDYEQVLVLNPQSGSPAELFRLRDGQLSTGGNYGIPLSVVYTRPQVSPVLVLGPPDGGPNLVPLKVGAFPDGGALTLKQFDPSTPVPPKSFSIMGPPFPGTAIGLDGAGPPLSLQIERDTVY